MEEIYSKKDLINGLNAYIEQLKEQRAVTTGVEHAVLQNVIVSLEEIANGFNQQEINMKPNYLLDVGDKVQTKLGVVGKIVKVYSGRYLVLKTEDGYYTCDKQVCKYIGD